MTDITPRDPVVAEGGWRSDEGVWILIFGDMIIFGLLFFTYLYYRMDEAALFATSQAALNRGFAAFNTILLLTGSWTVATAVRMVGTGNERRVPYLLGATVSCALGFIAVKIFEYGTKIEHGITGGTNDFFMFYFVMTGVHFVHVLLTTAFLIFLWLRSLTPRWVLRNAQFIEVGALIWHLVDLLWIVLFPLLYLVR